MKILSLIGILLLLFMTTPTQAQTPVEPPLDPAMEEPVVEFARARVLLLEELPEEGGVDEFGFPLRSFRAELELVSGRFRGQVVEITHVLTGTPAYDIVIEEGDRVLVGVETVEGELQEVVIADYERDRSLYALTLLFAGMLVGLGGKKGLKSLLSLIVIGILILYVFVPFLLRGASPIVLSVAVSAMATIFTILLVGGVNRKSAAAILGTLGGVSVAGALAIVVGGATHASGLSGQEAQMLMFIPQGISFDFRALLMASIIIGALGAVMDIGMSISSAMTEIRRADPTLSRRALFWSGMNVGRDVMGTMANTLILAYTGGSLALLLLVTAYEVPFVRLINMDSIASEVLRALAGSVGLVAAIPVTALAAAWLMRPTAHHRP
ncbi:MAG: YibE/F family protein [Thermaerobacter sp.]|nr:YibE/F family protein [Thermaerobacter sp.]